MVKLLKRLAFNRKKNNTAKSKENDDNCTKTAPNEKDANKTLVLSPTTPDIMPEEDCPICCEELAPGDSIFALHCPTAACNFNYCRSCIQNMCLSAADGYQEASDGSNQVKVHVQCPQCRGKYECKAYNSEVIVSSVLLLRQAHGLTNKLSMCDSDLPASELGGRATFLRNQSIEGLQDAVRRLRVYHDDHAIADKVPDLDWKEWSKHLPATCDKSKQQSLGSNGGLLFSNKEPPFIDATLFMGLEELMTTDEQEFVTGLLISSEPQLLQQAAQILHGMLHVSHKQTAGTTLAQLSLGGGGNTSNAPARAQPRPLSQQELKDLNMARKRWPLPTRMPRLVQLPVYDPDSSAKLLKFKKNTNELVLAAVRGPAGRSGLRVGDIVTHLQGEEVDVQETFSRRMAREFADDPTETVTFVVNADMETATALMERSKEIRQHRAKVKQQRATASSTTP